VARFYGVGRSTVLWPKTPGQTGTVLQKIALYENDIDNQCLKTKQSIEVDFNFKTTFALN